MDRYASPKHHLYSGPDEIPNGDLMKTWEVDGERNPIIAISALSPGRLI